MSGICHDCPLPTKKEAFKMRQRHMGEIGTPYKGGPTTQHTPPFEGMMGRWVWEMRYGEWGVGVGCVKQRWCDGD